MTMHYLTLASMILVAATGVYGLPVNGSSPGPIFTGGHATFFFQGGAAGACGDIHTDWAPIAALAPARYGALNTKSPNCGRQIKLTNTNNGRSITVVVADGCPTCGNENDLDLSVGAFTLIAAEQDGRVPINWQYLD